VPEPVKLDSDHARRENHAVGSTDMIGKESKGARPCDSVHGRLRRMASLRNGFRLAAARYWGSVFDIQFLQKRN
jgi:hypothetical protein